MPKNMFIKHALTSAILLLVSLNAFASPATFAGVQKDPDAGIFFDDFNYADTAELSNHGWIVRSKLGLPGIDGAHWGGDTVSVINDPAKNGNRLLHMTARTDGSTEGTFQSQVCHQRKYFEGTYASRVYLSDAPTTGSDGDVVVQSFYLVSPLRHAFDPEYSELDWEYLANGGWGEPRTRLYSTSWQTVRLDPWSAYNHAHEVFRPLGGWHILLMQVSGGKTHFFLDGEQVDESGGRNYPAVPMSLNFNIWYVADGFLPNTKVQRSYTEDIDWVFHARNRVMSPAEVDAAVKAARKAGAQQTDTVPAADPALPSTCDF